MALAPLIGALSIVGFFYLIFNYYRNVVRYPKGPFPLPFIGNMLSLHPRGLHNDIRKLSLEYGPVFTIFIPVPLVVITDYEALKEAFITKGEDFVDRPVLILDEEFEFCENAGVIGSNGNSWRENRRQAISILRDFGMGKGVMEEMVKLSIGEYLNWLDHIEDKSKVDMRWPIQFMIANIINEVLFGFRYEYDKGTPLIEYVEAINEFVTNLSGNLLRFVVMKLPWIKHIPIIGYYAVTRHKEQMSRMKNYISSTVDQAMARGNNDQEPDCFVHAYMQKIGSNDYLTKEQLYATCSDFFAAGQETTTTTLRWAMLFLADNQEQQERIREEVLSVCGPHRLPSMSDKPNLPYTSAAVHEIQRRANMLMMNVMRMTTVDTEVMGHKIPKGTSIDGDIYQVMAHDPIFENPELFRPERYLSEDGKKLKKDLLDRTIPFSIGKRQCAGEGLARVELLLGLAATVQHYRILPSSDGPVDLTPNYNFLMSPKDQKVRIEPV